ncbi:hypothetical protein IPG41_01200 [Candidatus Peregrinibacteria bacterium]|nr:MAG: hypothetical protein IPG41_01200 [Candidatus Peregrinibacteria bacterium]
MSDNEVFHSNHGGVSKENPHELVEGSAKETAYRALELKYEVDHNQRAQEAFQEKGYQNPEEIRKILLEGPIDPYDPKKESFDKKGDLLKRDSLYLILVDFFRKCYSTNPSVKELAHKEALMSLAYLTEQKMNVDKIPAHGKFKIENGKLFISKSSNATTGDICNGLPLIKQGGSVKSL